MPSVDVFAAAIAVMEGARQADGSYRYNNPGNVDDWNTSGFQLKQFASASLGFSSVYYEIKKRIDKGYNLYEFFAGGKNGTVKDGYAPAGHGKNNPQVYSAFVGNALGIPTNVPLNSYGWTNSRYFVSNPMQNPRAFIDMYGKNDGTVVSGNQSQSSGGSETAEMGWIGEIERTGLEVLGELQKSVTLPIVGMSVPLWGVVLGGVALLVVVKK